MEGLRKILVNNKVSIKEAMRVIDQGSIKMAVVVNNTGQLCGIVTDGDIRRGILKGISIDENVSVVMNKHPVYVYEGTPRGEIVKLLKDKKILGLPIVDNRKIVKDFILLSGGTEISHFSQRPRIRKHIDRVLVIGGAGYIGSMLVRKLLAKGYKVSVLDIFLYGRESLREVESHPNLKIIEGDTRHIEDITNAVRDVDAVVHLAEIVGDPACALNPLLTQENNYLATKIIASVCKHFQINRLVYASSCSVYGASKEDELLTEESPLNPVSLYAKMKIASEKALMEMKDENFLPTILRLGTVFGFSHRLRLDLVINTLTAKAFHEGKIQIFGGSQWRPFVHVSDVCNAIIKVLEAPIHKVKGEIFNVGSEKHNLQIKRLGEFIKNKLPNTRIEVKEKDVDKRDYKVSFEKIRKTLGFGVEKTVDDGILELKEAFEKGLVSDYSDEKYSNYVFLNKKIIRKK